MSLASFSSRINTLAATATLLTLLVAGCASSNTDSVSSTSSGALPAATVAEFSTAATPPFFHVEGRGGARLDILGTIHLGPSGGWTFAPPVNLALARADAFMLEIDLRGLDENRAGDLLASLAILPVGTTLEDVVSPETAKLLDQHDSSLAEIGFPRNARRHKKPWYLVTSIISLDSQKSGFDLTQSVESAILAAAGARPMMALETFEDQLNLLDRLSPRIQDIMLRDALERRHESTKDIEALVDAWTNNDQVALAAIASQGVEEHPELVVFYDALLKDRNQRWAARLSSILDDPRRSQESIFVGVGALHLVGPNSLITLLEKAGYHIESVEPPASPGL